MKVLIILPSGKVIYPHYIPYLLGAVLKRNRFSVDILEIENISSFWKDKIDKLISWADVIYIWINKFFSKISKELICRIKKEYPDIPLVIGGKYPSFFYKELIKEIPVDFIIRGEQEKTLPRLLKYIRNKKEIIRDIHGVTYKKGKDIFHNPNSKFLKDKEYEQLPFPLYEKLPAGIYDSISMETSRGRPFYSPFKSLLYEKEWKAISPMGIYERIYWAFEHITPKTRGKNIYLIDDYFTAKAKRIIDFKDIYLRKNVSFKLEYKTRCSDLIDEFLVESLSVFTHKIHIPVWSGYNLGLGHLRKGYTIKIIKDSAKILLKYGLNELAQYEFITGFPWETKKEIDKTCQFAKELKEQFNVIIKIKGFQ